VVLLEALGLQRGEIVGPEIGGGPPLAQDVVVDDHDEAVSPGDECFQASASACHAAELRLEIASRAARVGPAQRSISRESADPAAHSKLIALDLRPGSGDRVPVHFSVTDRPTQRNLQKEMKRRLEKSSDLADSLMLSFVEPQQEPEYSIDF
jgi:hypothetical protein